MTKSRRKAFLAGIGAFIVTLCVAASSWSMSHGEGERDPSRKLEHMTRKLDLTEQQQADIGKLLTQSAGQSQADHARMKVLRQSAHEQRKAYDSAELQAIADEIGQITSRMVYERGTQQAKIYAVLSAEQQEKMDAMMEKRKMRKRHKRPYSYDS